MDNHKKNSPSYSDGSNRHHRRRQENRSSRSQKRWALMESLHNWARKTFLPDQAGSQSLSFFFRKGARVLQTRGVKGLIRWVKTLRQSYIQYLANPDSPSSKRAKAKVLKAFGRQGRQCVLKHDNADNVRLIMIALTASRSFRLPVQIDLGRIEDKSTGRWTLPSLALVKKFWKDVKVPDTFGIPSHSRWKEFHIRTRKGPQGPAMNTYPFELPHLEGAVKDRLITIGGPGIEEYLGVLLENQHHLKEGLTPPAEMREGVLRRVVGIPDMEGKTRPVAIFDYMSQTVLRGVHLTMFEILKLIPQDMTFSQRSVLDKVRMWRVGTLHATDLSKATDRFPRELVRLVLEGSPRMYPEWLAAWEHLMVGIPFAIEGFPGRRVSYTVGLPMGGYSCWASFALAHHFVVYWCCKDLGINWKTAPYIILGDDVLIGDDRLGELYRARVQALGVEVSASKSTNSKEFAEFAKRYFRRTPRGTLEEVTPFPLSRVADRPGQVALVVSALAGEERKGIRAIQGIPRAVGSLLRLMHYRRTYIRKAMCRAWEIDLFSRVLKGQIRVEKGVTLLLNAYLGPLETRETEEWAHLYVESALRKMVKTSWTYRWDLREEALGEVPVGPQDLGLTLRDMDPLCLVFRDVIERARRPYVRALSRPFGERVEQTRMLLRGLSFPNSIEEMVTTDKDRAYIFGGKLAKALLGAARDLDYPTLNPEMDYRRDLPGLRYRVWKEEWDQGIQQQGPIRTLALP